jgi:hypothetical protein
VTAALDPDGSQLHTAMQCTACTLGAAAGVMCHLIVVRTVLFRRTLPVRRHRADVDLRPPQARDCWAVAFGDMYSDEERALLAGYDNGDVKMFDLRTNKCALADAPNCSV